MAKFRKVETRIWNDAKFRLLSDKAQLVFFFLMTHPHMSPVGAMRATIPGLAAELSHWPEKAFREAFNEVLSKGMAEHDETAHFLALPNFLKYNGPESPNVVKSWAKCWDDIPECGLKSRLFQRVMEFTDALTEGFGEAFREVFAKGMPNQEKEKETKQEKEKEPPLSSSDDDGGATAINRTDPEGEEKPPDPKPPTPKQVKIETVYQAYPRKVGKKAALTSIDKALKLISFEELLEAVQDYARRTAGANLEKIPHPATWFNRHGWLDDRRDWDRAGRETPKNGHPGPGQKFDPTHRLEW